MKFQPHWLLRLTCLVVALIFLSGLQQMGPWGPLFATAVGAVGIANLAASEIAAAWRQS